MSRLRAPADPVVRRSVLDELDRVLREHPDRPPRMLDVGGGSGAMAVPLAMAGSEVAVVDASPNALAAVHRRVGQAGVATGVCAVQGDVDALGGVVEHVLARRLDSGRIG